MKKIEAPIIMLGEGICLIAILIVNKFWSSYMLFPIVATLIFNAILLISYFSGMKSKGEKKKKSQEEVIEIFNNLGLAEKYDLQFEKSEPSVFFYPHGGFWEGHISEIRNNKMLEIYAFIRDDEDYAITTKINPTRESVIDLRKRLSKYHDDSNKEIEIRRDPITQREISRIERNIKQVKEEVNKIGDTSSEEKK